MNQKVAIELLDNWAGWLRGSVGGAGGYCSSMYMSPEEKALAGGSCRVARWNEQDGMRVEALLGVMNQDSSQQFFVRLLKAHFFMKVDPRKVCRVERLVYQDYSWHVNRAVEVFLLVFEKYRLTATKELRKNALNNLLPLRRDSHPSRALSYV